MEKRDPKIKDRACALPFAIGLLLLWAWAPAAVALATEARQSPSFLQDVEIGPALFEVVEIARTAEERKRGLQNRATLPDTTAMAFVAMPPRPQVFWMKGTRFPLDIVFLDINGRILEIQSMAVEPPQAPNESESAYEQRLPRYICRQAVFCALEIRGGLAAELGLKPGDIVPALSARALII